MEEATESKGEVRTGIRKELVCSLKSWRQNGSDNSHLQIFSQSAQAPVPGRTHLTVLVSNLKAEGFFDEDSHQAVFISPQQSVWHVICFCWMPDLCMVGWCHQL